MIKWRKGNRQKNNSLAIKQSQGPFSSFSRVIDNILSDILWVIFQYWNSYQVGEVNQMLPTSMFITPDWLESEGWWRWLPITLSPTNQKHTHKLITHPTTPPRSHLVFKNLPLKVFREFGSFEHEWSEVAQSCLTLCDPMDSGLHQAPPSMGFSRQEYWSGLPFPSPGNLPDLGIEPRSPAL